MPDLATVDRGANPILGRRAEPFCDLVDYDDALQRAHHCFERAQQATINSLRPMSLHEQASDLNGARRSRITGRQRYERLRHALKLIGIVFSDDQLAMLDRMVAAAAKQIFKDDLQENLEDLLAELGIKELHQELLALMPRRFGKTWVVAAFVVALLFAIEGPFEIGVFSTGRRASGKMQDTIYWFVCQMGGLNIVKHNVESLWVQGPYGPGDLRKLSSYPSNVRISLLFFSFFFFACVL